MKEEIINLIQNGLKTKLKRELKKSEVNGIYSIASLIEKQVKEDIINEVEELLSLIGEKDE